MLHIVELLRRKSDDVITLTHTLRYEILIALCVLFIVYQLISFIKGLNKKYPPGPYGLPLVGYLPFITENLHLDLIELGKKYGSVFSLKLGSIKMIILNDAEALKEALGKSEFLGRPPDSDLSLVFPGSPFFSGDMDRWKEQRRFVFQIMKDLGLGKSKIEIDVQDEIYQLLQNIKLHNGEPMDPKHILFPSMSNNICALVFGKRYAYNDPVRKDLDANMEVGTHLISQQSPLTFFPWMQYIPFLKKSFNLERSATAFNNIKDICKREIEKHKETYDPKMIRGFIDRYLSEMESRKKTDADTTFSEDTLAAVLLDIFGAGSDTVNTSILWSLYIIAAYPNVQKKVQKEIMDVIGSERRPEFSDQKQMPYTHAVILEMSRWKTIAPLSLLRYTTSDATVKGFYIPQGTTVMANLWAVHHDPNLWADPDQFVPERFLNSDGRSVVKSSNFMSFSLGRRSCPGETMANMEIFLYFTSILQKFAVVLPDGVAPTYDAKITVTYKLHPYSVKFIAKTA